MRPVILGARGSALSLRQTELVRQALAARHPARGFVVEPIAAAADRRPETPLAAFEGEGIFVTALEDALRSRRIDLAVHSLKDVPLAQPTGLVLAAVASRDDARDALVSRDGLEFRALPPGARIGTSSLRRRSQLLALRRDVELLDIRGNVDTRLRKLDEGQYDAIVLAAAGLMRLGLTERITQRFACEELLPEPGQGALAVEVRSDDADARDLARALDDAPTRACVEAERALLGALGGGCRVPIAAHAAIAGSELVLDGAVIAPDGSRALRDQMTGPSDAPQELGRRLGERLITQGARDILNAIALRP